MLLLLHHPNKIIQEKQQGLWTVQGEYKKGHITQYYELTRSKYTKQWHKPYQKATKNKTGTEVGIAKPTRKDIMIPQSSKFKVDEGTYKNYN